MNNWHQPDWHYSFKPGMSFPNAPPAAEAAANAAAMPPPHHPYHGQGYGHGRGYYYRPRFGIFRRLVWFGLGVGAANWYLHHRDRRDQLLQCLSDGESVSPNATGHRATDTFQERNNHDWRGRWRYPHDSEMARPRPIPVAAQSEPDSKIIASLPGFETTTHEAEQTKWGWGSRREERRKRKEEMRATKVESHDKEELQKIKEAVDKIWAERKQAAVEIQATANEKAKEYARVKLETLSQAVDTLRAALTSDAEKARDPKLV